MSVTVEKLEKSMAKLTITVGAADFDNYVEKVFQKQKHSISVPGFRKGKAPRKVIEKMYGDMVFFEDAANNAINETYPDAVKESGEEIVSNPSIDISQIEAGKDFIYTAEVALKPPVSLGKYKGVEIARIEKAEVSDEDIEAELKRQQDANAKIVDVTDRAVKDGDDIKLDFAGTVDGVAFDGGTATDYDLVIGSGSFIPGFEDQLIGAKIGEEKDVNVTFPEDYQAKELAGKPAVFACTVRSIKEKQLPELNDEFADEVSEFSTLDEYKADIKKNLESQREETYQNTRQNAAVDAAVADAEIELPEAMVQTQAESLAQEFGQNMAMQGMRLQDYLQYTGMTQQQFVEQMKPQAQTRIKNSLVLEAIADAEKIEVADEELEAEYERMAKQYNMPVENVKKVFADEDSREDLKRDARLRKAAELVAENAVETAEKKAAKKSAKKADDAEEAPAAEEKPAKKRTRKAAKKDEAAEETSDAE
jgi:trigger factor